MKKILFNSIFLFILFLPVMGQLRHVKGISNIGVTYGINENGSVYGAVYSQYLQTVWIWNINAFYETGNVESTNSEQYMISSGVDYTYFQLFEFIYFNAGLSVFGGLEKLTSNEPRIKDVQNYIAGPAGNINVELYLGSRFLFQIKAEQFYSPLSKYGKLFPVYSLSLKYCIF